MGGQTALMSFWHALTEAFTAAGFRIAVISELEPAPAARELFPDEIAARPRFLRQLLGHRPVSREGVPGPHSLG